MWCLIQHWEQRDCLPSAQEDGIGPLILALSAPMVLMSSALVLLFLSFFLIFHFTSLHASLFCFILFSLFKVIYRYLEGRLFGLGPMGCCYGYSGANLLHWSLPDYCFQSWYYCLYFDSKNNSNLTLKVNIALSKLVFQYTLTII